MNANTISLAFHLVKHDLIRARLGIHHIYTRLDDISSNIDIFALYLAHADLGCAHLIFFVVVVVVGGGGRRRFVGVIATVAAVVIV